MSKKMLLIIVANVVVLSLLLFLLIDTFADADNGSSDSAAGSNDPVESSAGGNSAGTNWLEDNGSSTNYNPGSTSSLSDANRYTPPVIEPDVPSEPSEPSVAMPQFSSFLNGISATVGERVSEDYSISNKYTAGKVVYSIERFSSLPTGLYLDSSSGMISGTAYQSFDGEIVLLAENEAGTASLKISVEIDKAAPYPVSRTSYCTGSVGRSLLCSVSSALRTGGADPDGTVSASGCIPAGVSYSYGSFLGKVTAKTGFGCSATFVSTPSSFRATDYPVVTLKMDFSITDSGF